MDIGLILVIVALILGIVALFVPDYSQRLLAAGLVLLALGVIFGSGNLTLR